MSAPPAIPAASSSPLKRARREQRVIILAPTVRDGQATSEILHSAGIECTCCTTLERVVAEISIGCAAVLIPEEAVVVDDFDRLEELMHHQPVWSDLPVVLLSRVGADSTSIDKIVAALGNVSVVERPMRISTFLSVVKVAVRARERQYQVRDHLKERQQVEAMLSRDAALLINVRDSVIVTDLTGVVTYWNDGATKLFGWTSEEMMGRHIETRAPEEIRPEIRMRIARIAAGETELNGEWLDWRKDGSRVWIEARMRMARGRNGEPIGIIGVSRDTTQRKQAELELKAAKEAAESANAAKDDFLAILSHELRTPLTPVLLSASMLEANPLLPAEMQQEVAMIRSNIELESRLIGDLLDVTRISKGKLKLDMQECDLHQLIRGAIAICQREASARLTVELGARLSTVRGDSTRLQQIFWNLINNASKFTGPNGTIAVRSSDVGKDRVRIEVIDTGEGIDPELLPRLFNAFEQGRVRTTKQRAGLGLGLAISKKLTELHGGTIFASSAGVGRGATFTVELPGSPARDQLAALLPVETTGTGVAALRILLVEDHESTLDIMCKLLRSRGHHVTGVNSVATATAAAEFDYFDLIISDLGLPDGSGLDVMRTLQKRYAGRAIALTGYGMDADIEACLRAGFATHLTKPVNLPDLEAAIRRVATKGC